MATQETLLSEIARKLRKLDCICEGVNATGNIVIKNYQVLDCNGDPIGSPIDVMPTISVAKQDVSICNTDALALAITGIYNVSTMSVVPINTVYSLTDLGVTVEKLHSISFTVLTGTVSISGTLGGGTQTATGLPVGVSSGWTASTEFGTGGIEFTTNGTGTILITAMSKI